MPTKTPLPNLFIPGAPKCGTSALAAYLNARPEVSLGRIKEPNFWSNDLPSFARREGLLSDEHYRALYEACAVSPYRLDASTHYLFSEVAIPRIVDAVDDARFIICIRPQPQIAHAWHMQMHNAGYETEAHFPSAWALRTVRRRGDQIPGCCPEPRLLDYEAIASVGQQLERVLSVVASERVHVMRLDDLRVDPRREYLAILGFLGLDADQRTDFSAQNVAHRNRSKSLSRLVRHPSIRPWLNRALRLTGPLAGRLRTGVKSMLYKPAARSPLSDEVAQSLANCFAEDDQKVFRILGYGLLPASESDSDNDSRTTTT